MSKESMIGKSVYVVSFEPTVSYTPNITEYVFVTRYEDILSAKSASGAYIAVVLNSDLEPAYLKNAFMSIEEAIEYAKGRVWSEIEKTKTKLTELSDVYASLSLCAD